MHCLPRVQIITVPQGSEWLPLIDHALDKLIGAILRAGLDRSAGAVLITSRASVEMVQKVATLGIGMLVAISAPTSLAIELAQETGVGLLGFVRQKSYVVYAHPERLFEKGE